MAASRNVLGCFTQSCADDVLDLKHAKNAEDKHFLYHPKNAKDEHGYLIGKSDGFNLRFFYPPKETWVLTRGSQRGAKDEHGYLKQRTWLSLAKMRRDFSQRSQRFIDKLHL